MGRYKKLKLRKITMFTNEMISKHPYDLFRINWSNLKQVSLEFFRFEIKNGSKTKRRVYLFALS